jgi:hypothetical protein
MADTRSGRQDPGSRPWSGTADRGVPGSPANTATSSEGYPPGSWGDAIFGGPLPTTTGAPGTTGAQRGAGTDPTNEPGQLTEGLSGTGPADNADSGAPGMATNPRLGGGTTVRYTDPGAYLSADSNQNTVSTALYGNQDSTQANGEGYGTGGPQLPGIMGNEPVPGGKYQPGSGRVLRGGRAVRP